MKEIKVYEAFDGTRFDTESTCKRYEEKHFVPDDIKKAILRLSSFCGERDKCERCPLHSKEDDGACALLHHLPSFWDRVFGE